MTLTHFIVNCKRHKYFVRLCGDRDAIIAKLQILCHLVSILSYVGRILHTVYTADCKSEFFGNGPHRTVMSRNSAGDIAVDALSAG